MDFTHINYKIANCKMNAQTLYNIWFVDDDPNIRKVLSAVLRCENYEVKEFASAEELLSSLQKEWPNLVISDLQMPGMDGIELFSEIRKLHSDIPVIFLTAFGSIDKAVEAMKKGAYDFLTKPVSNDKLIITVRNALEYFRLKNELHNLNRKRDEDIKNLLAGSSVLMSKVRELIAKIAEQNTTVLLLGETGTGKEIAARAIHRLSDRSAFSFVPVNCGAVPANIIESELFGHTRGAFTGAVSDRKGIFVSADKGTIFLDEIGELPYELQSKLLRVIQERKVVPVGSTKEIELDVRIIAATNRDLNEMVKNNKFREDLFFRINVFPISLPPLRERKEDIPLLTAHLLRQKTAEPPLISPEALKLMMEYNWPGNVRELDNVLERSLIMTDEDIIRPDHIIFGKEQRNESSLKFILPEKGVPIDDVEKDLIMQALSRTQGNQTKAAKLLGITRSALLYRISKYGL